MAIGTKTDFVIYDREFFSGMDEVLQQNTNVFNAGSNGAIRLVTTALKGDFEKQSFMKKITGGTVSHRDITSTASVTPNKMDQGELISPKVNRRIGPNSNTIDQWKKIGEDPRMFSYFYGRQVAEDVAADWLNTTILAGVACIESNPSLVYNATTETDPKLRTEYLTRALRLMGDKANRVSAWVMHSATFYDLVESQVLDKITNVADTVIYAGVPGSFNRPIIVTDSPALIETDGVAVGVDAYKVLGLTDDALVVTQSEDQFITSDMTLGLENIVMTIQGEYAFNPRVKGFSYTGATVNPDDAALGTGTNWSFAMHDVKLGPGVLIKVSG